MEEGGEDWPSQCTMKEKHGVRGTPKLVREVKDGFWEVVAFTLRQKGGRGVS